DFSTLRVNDLLIEQIANHSEHVFVGVIRGQALVLQVDAFGTDGLDLVVTDAQPARTGPHQKAVEADGVNQRYQRRVAKRSNTAAFQVVHLDAQKFRQVQNLFRHTYRTQRPEYGAVLPSLRITG